MNARAETESLAMRYASLDHWRALAALMVVMVHSSWAFLAMAESSPGMNRIREVANFGHFGVHMFFVISGYCIAANVHRSWTKGRSPGEFLMDRFLRIYPLYWVALLIQSLTILATGIFSQAAGPMPLAKGAWEWVTNILLIEPYAGTRPGMIVTWTLVHEFGFYLLVCIGFALARRRPSLEMWMLCAIALAFLSLCPLPQPGLHVLTYWPEFLFGSLVYLARLNAARNRIFYQSLCCGIVVVFLVAASLTGKVDQQPYLPYAGCFALVLLLLGRFDEAIARWKYLKWMGTIGVFSYSLYLIHVPILLPASNLARRIMLVENPAMIVVAAGMCLVSVFGGYCFHLSFEQPLEYWRHRVLDGRKSARGARRDVSCMRPCPDKTGATP